MTDFEIIEKAISDGYYVVGIFSIAKIQNGDNESRRTGNFAQSVDAFIKTFNIQKGKDVLLNPENRDKFIVILKKECGNQIEIITSCSECIKKTEQQLAYQNEPVGIMIRVECIALGGSSEPDQITYVDQLISQLDNLLGWHFKQTGKSTFEVSKKLDSTNEEDAKQELNRLHDLLNYIAITIKSGIRIERYAVSKIPRVGPYHGILGPDEFRPSITVEEVKRFEKFLSAPPEIREIASALNQVYTLKSRESRLALLWAITEAVFADEPKPLLLDNEIKSILKCAMETVKGQERLKELEKVLKDPNRLPSKSRNRRISENIAKALELNAEDVYQKIKTIAKIRGRYLHRLKSESEKLRIAEKYLRDILEAYLERKLK